MKEIFAIGDVHGEIKQLEKLLSFWKPETQQLILTGDLIDRGSNSLAVVQLAMKLKEQHGAIILMGNHEEMFLNWLKNPDDDYPHQDSISTIVSFIGQTLWYKYDSNEARKLLYTKYPKEMKFIESLEDYYETANQIFVHAGLDLELENWNETSSTDMKWIRRDFHFGENNTGKTIVFGHTPTKLLHHPIFPSHDVWISPCKTKIGIDGGAYFGGLLHGLIVDDSGYKVVSIGKNLNVIKKEVIQYEK